MTPEQYEDIINQLLNLIETLIGQKIATVCLLEVLLPDYDWYSHVTRAEQLHAERLHELLLPLRTLIVASHDETIPEIDWRQIVQKLVESVDKGGLDDDPDLTK